VSVSSTKALNFRQQKIFMTNIPAVFKNGRVEPSAPIDLPDGTVFRILDEYGVPLKLGTDKTYLEIKEILEEMLQTKEAVKTWLNSSGRGASKTPLEYILEGNLDATRRMVAALEYGIPA
jgi:hypothetical protein